MKVKFVRRLKAAPSSSSPVPVIQPACWVMGAALLNNGSEGIVFCACGKHQIWSLTPMSRSNFCSSLFTDLITGVA